MRRSEWPVLFETYIESHRNMPFQWGHNDCCFFAAGWFELCSGSEILKDQRGTYATALGAARRIEELGGLAAIADEYLTRHLNSNFASVGDIVLIHNEGRDLLAICNGSVVFAPGEHGIITLPMSTAIVAWRV